MTARPPRPHPLLHRRSSPGCAARWSWRATSGGSGRPCECLGRASRATCASHASRALLPRRGPTQPPPPAALPLLRAASTSRRLRVSSSLRSAAGSAPARRSAATATTTTTATSSSATTTTTTTTPTSATTTSSTTRAARCRTTVTILAAAGGRPARLLPPALPAAPLDACKPGHCTGGRTLPRPALTCGPDASPAACLPCSRSRSRSRERRGGWRERGPEPFAPGPQQRWERDRYREPEHDGGRGRGHGGRGSSRSRSPARGGAGGPRQRGGSPPGRLPASARLGPGAAKPAAGLFKAALQSTVAGTAAAGGGGGRTRARLAAGMIEGARLGRRWHGAARCAAWCLAGHSWPVRPPLPAGLCSLLDRAGVPPAELEATLLQAKTTT
jgi:hypothetical protein